MAEKTVMWIANGLAIFVIGFSILVGIGFIFGFAKTKRYDRMAVVAVLMVLVLLAVFDFLFS